MGDTTCFRFVGICVWAVIVTYFDKRFFHYYVQDGSQQKYNPKPPGHGLNLARHSG